MVVYDITNQNSFKNVKNWIEDIRNESPSTVLIVLVGNKIDLADKRLVSFDEGNDFATENGIFFGETSAKSGEGIETIFSESAKQIAKNIKENYYDLTSETCGIKKGNANKKNQNNNNVELQAGKNKKEKKCC